MLQTHVALMVNGAFQPYLGSVKCFKMSLSITHTHSLMQHFLFYTYVLYIRSTFTLQSHTYEPFNAYAGFSEEHFNTQKGRGFNHQSNRRTTASECIGMRGVEKRTHNYSLVTESSVNRVLIHDTGE